MLLLPIFGAMLGMLVWLLAKSPVGRRVGVGIMGVSAAMLALVMAFIVALAYGR